MIGESGNREVGQSGNRGEEADESVYWLEYFSDTGPADDAALRSLLREGRELVAILTTSVQTARRRNRPR